MRLSVPGLLGNPDEGRRLAAALGRRPGVLEARADPRTGRVLVRYVPGASVGRELAALGAPAPSPGRPDPRGRARPSPGAAGRAVLTAVERTRAGGARGPELAPPAAGEAGWHALPAAAALARLGSRATGLAPDEVAARQRRFGLNVRSSRAPRSTAAMVLSQVANLPSALLVGAAGVAALLGDVLEASAVLGVLGLNAVAGYVIERKNEQILAAWRRMEASTVEVVRAGRIESVSAAELVPGDILLVSAGDVVPADARVLAAERLACDEAPLTGESEARRKRPQPVAAAAVLAERAAMLYAGTSVATGHGRAVVTATGNATELGRVRQELERARAPEAPLTRRLGQVTNRVTLLAVGAAAAAAGVGVLRRQPGAAVLRSAVALGVATIPEGLPLVATAALIRSMQRLREQGMIVRRLAAAETLGGVTVICADKTGTLTRNEMRLEVLELAGGRVDLATARARGDAPLEDPFTLALMIGLLNSDVEVQRGGGAATVSGSSTERALVQAAWAAGLDGARLRLAFPRRLLRERDGAMRYVVSIHDTPAGGAVTLVKGAPEQVVALCDRGATGPLDDAARARLLARNADLAGAGLRVLALAFAPGGQPDPRGGLTFVGLAALRDPPRAGARAAIADAARAGVRTLMLTGDQRLTAEAIARAVGLAGETLGRDEALALAREPSGAAAARLRRVAVIARVTPSDKAEVVRALRRSGELVAMAGDGINDAPALKLADVGMAVGSSASDLAREVADVVLAREELSALVAAVGEGRVVQDNLRRAVRFLVATNLSETALMIGGLLVAGQAPLTPLQLLWINLLSDTLPALALALDRGRPGILDRPPAAPGAPILTSAARRVIVRDGLWLGLAGGAGFVLGGPRLAMPVLVGAQLGYTALCRAPDVGGDGEFARLLGAAAGLQLATLLIPPLRRVLGLGPVTGLEIAAYAGALAAPLWASRRRRLRPVVARGRAVNPSLERSRP